MPQAPLRPIPRAWTAFAIATAILSTWFAHAGHRREAAAPVAVVAASPLAHAGVVAARVR